jgi:hypothetical protein
MERGIIAWSLTDHPELVEIFSAIVCFALGLLLQPALDRIKKRNMRHEPV